MTGQKITHAATGRTTKPGKRISLREHLKSALFLAAIYTLIINQAYNEKTEAKFFENETAYQSNISQAETKNRQFVLPTLVYSSIKIIFYPSALLWK